MAIMQDETRRPKSVRDYAKLYLTGVAMGSADTVPGVSGGTVAFVLGIYSDLLNAIKSINGHSLRLLLKLDLRGFFEYVPWQFIVTLGLGIATAVLTLARLVDWAMEHQRVYLFALFMGLVLGSAVAILPRIRRWNITMIAALVLGAVFAYLLVGAVPQENLSHDPLTLFLSGMAAITAMILPGISGSSILLVLGQYRFALNAVKTFDIVSLVSLAAGCAVGIMAFSRVLSWLLKRYEQATVAVLIGFVIGSLRAVWPWKIAFDAGADEAAALAASANAMPDVSSPEFLGSVLMIVIGFLIVNLLDHVASGENPVFRSFWRRPVAITAAE